MTRYLSVQAILPADHLVSSGWPVGLGLLRKPAVAGGRVSCVCPLSRTLGVTNVRVGTTPNIDTTHCQNKETS